jgi:hypothetical protein
LDVDVSVESSVVAVGSTSTLTCESTTVPCESRSWALPTPSPVPVLICEATSEELVAAAGDGTTRSELFDSKMSTFTAISFAEPTSPGSATGDVVNNSLLMFGGMIANLAAADVETGAGGRLREEVCRDVLGGDCLVVVLFPASSELRAGGCLGAAIGGGRTGGGLTAGGGFGVLCDMIRSSQ